MMNLTRRFTRSYTGRMLTGTLLIHVVLIPLLFVGIVHLVENDYRAEFVDHARTQSYLLASLMEQTNESSAIARIADDLVLSGHVAYADYVSASGTDYLSAFNQPLTFREDFFFGEHNDHVFCIVIPARSGNGAVLRVAFDELAAEDHIAKAYRLGLALAAGYVVLTLLFIAFFGQMLTKSIRQLRDASRRIANGEVAERLYVSTDVSEVHCLAQDLEAMRQELVQRGEEIALREARQRAVLETAAEGIIIVTADGLIESFNKAAQLIFCRSAADVVHTSFAELLAPADAGRFFASSGEPYVCVATEMEGVRNSNETFHITISVSEANAGGSRCFTILVQDISERHAFESRLTHLATHDALTGLPNRSLFIDRLTQVLSCAARDQQTVAMLFMDLDRFKYINDTLGHNVGDILLQNVAERLKAILREQDTLARLGGDEFTLILPHTMHTSGAATVAQNILETLQYPFQIGGQELFIGASIGIAFYPNDGSETNQLVKNADSAMYEAKRLGGNNFQFYAKEMNAKASSCLEIESRLRYALERDELVLHYQPLVAARNGRIVGVEALLRWRHPQLGLVPPADFIPIAEETGAILPISEWVMRTACQQGKAWQDEGLDITLAVNLCARQFTQSDLFARIVTILEETGFPPQRLELEITESMVMQNRNETIATLQRLKALGLRLSLDDFGTGYSSLSYLRRFPIDTLKIDRSFTEDITANPSDAILASAIIAMAHGLKMGVIAEGVETEEQLAYLHSHHCDTFQGYYFSRPLPSAAVTTLLRKNLCAGDKQPTTWPILKTATG